MDELARLQAFLDRCVGGRRRLRVLDAGCGRELHVRLGEDPWVTGIDIASESLAANESVNERIVGDIQTYPLEPRSFEVVVCWDVLEHLSQPRLALANMAQAVVPGGLLVIAGPNLMSLKGLATRLTPMPVHRFAYRRMGSLEQPFPTFMRLATAPSRLVAWARSSPHALVVEHLDLYEAPMQVALRRRLRLYGRGWGRVRALVRAFTLGNVDPALTDFLMVLRRTGGERRGAAS